MAHKSVLFKKILRLYRCCS